MLSRLCSSISISVRIKAIFGVTVGDGSADHGNKHSGHVRETARTREVCLGVVVGVKMEAEAAAAAAV